jgi:iron complex outermembrane receptor protein
MNIMRIGMQQKMTRTFETVSTVRTAVAVVLYGAATAYPVMAAEARTATDSLDEITVTARKRTENLQDVPISIDVYSSKDLKNLAISQFEDYATLTPSISFISAGPGTQTFVMRGVSDGSNPSHENAATTIFLLDDMSMNYYGVTPDLHLYDLERIEVLNGPQGTTFGAGAMAGALRFITNKPDPRGFSAGVDFDGAKIDGGTHNAVAEGYINLPIISQRTALRISAYSDYHGGYINNLNVTRNWVNGTVSNNSQWAGRNYNVEKTTGARIALGQKFMEGWQSTLTYSYQRQLTHGAWDENTATGGAVDAAGNYVNGPPSPLGQKNVDRFGPEFKQYYTKTLDFHLDGDAGIGDLVYASTYWAQDDRWVNEYSEYMQYVDTSSLNATSRQAFTCLTDPINGSGFSGCSVPIMYFDNIQHTDRWSNELRLQSKEDGPFHWLAGVYWEKTRDIYSSYYHMPGLKTQGEQYSAYASYYGQTSTQTGSDDWYSSKGRSDYLQTTEFANITFDVTQRVHVEAGTVHFHSRFNTQNEGGYSYSTPGISRAPGSSTKWNSKLGVSVNATDDLLVYADVAQGFRDGGVNPGLPEPCVRSGVPAAFKPDTLTNYEIGWKSTWGAKRLSWNGAFYYMPWKNFQSLVYDPDICASNSFSANIGNARVYGTETNIKIRPTPSLSIDLSASYNDSRIVSDNFANASFTVTPGERLPYVAYFNWSGNVRYEAPIGDAVHGYAQFEAAHKGDMFNSLQTSGSNGLPYVLQPGYSVMNLRMGLTHLIEHWTGELYVTNLTNKKAVIYTNESNFDLRQTINQPRVLGARVSYRFGETGTTTRDE